MALHYVSAGSTTPAATHASITALNADGAVTSGDTVYFYRGETFAGATLATDAGVTYDAYGNGEKPIIDGEDTRDCISVSNATSVTIQNLELIDGVRCLLVSSSGGNFSANNLVVRGSVSNAVTSECIETISTGSGHTYTDITVYQPHNTSTSKGFRIVNNDCTLTNVQMLGVSGSTAYNAFEIQTCTVALNNVSITDWNGRGGSGSRLLYSREAVITSSLFTVTDSDGQLYIDDVSGGSDATFEELNVSGMTGVIQTLINCTLVVNSGTWDSAFSGVGDSVTINNVTTDSTITLNTGLVLASMTDVVVTGAGIVDKATTSVLTRCSVTGASVNGIAVSVGDTSLTSCSASGCGSNGLHQSSSSDVIDNAGNYSSNTTDGVSANGTGSVKCNGTVCNTNGSAAADSGDGFTSHDTSVLELKGCSASGNFKSGVGAVGSSTGLIHNCSFYDNYESTVASNVGILIDSAGAFTVKNCITESHTKEVDISAATVAAGTTVDNCCFNNTREASAFDYDGATTDYTTFAAKASVTNTINSDPLFTDKQNYDLSLKSESPCLGIGTRWWSGPNPVGPNGEPFSDFDTDIGANQSTLGPFHPTKL